MERDPILVEIMTRQVAGTASVSTPINIEGE
jgi:hypothetical protein